MSPSSQRVWIEILRTLSQPVWNMVALFTEGVDWNIFVNAQFAIIKRRPLHRGCGLKYICKRPICYNQAVALFTEGVDWNSHYAWWLFLWVNVALFTEGVDWNFAGLLFLKNRTLSPSSQRVWIEIAKRPGTCKIYPVALFTEGVDWNTNANRNSSNSNMSPSSQRVWIEISITGSLFSHRLVALFTEGVDWNGAVPSVP